VARAPFSSHPRCPFDQLLRVQRAVAVTLTWFGACLAALFVLTLRPGLARADGLDGSWSMTAVTESYTVQEWNASCGPAPVSRTMVPGGPVTVTASGGELIISGARTLRTDQCLDPMPTLARNVHSQDARAWRTRCSTPPSDPRHAVVNTAYFVVAGDTSISIAETGRYEFTINDAHCIADVRRGATLSRAAPSAATSASASPTGSAATTASAAPTDSAPAATAPDTTAVATATPTATTPTPTATSTAATPAPKADCSTPGDPARLEMRPSGKLLKLGDTFAFHASVVDASGCPTATPIQWTIGAVTFKDGQPHPGAPSVDGLGRLTIPSADFTDATFDLVATAAGRSAKAAVQVAIPADYAALLAQSGLGPTGERDEPAVAILATTSIGAADAKTEDGGRKRRFVFFGIIGALVLLLVVIAVVAGARGRAARKQEAAAGVRHAEKMRVYEAHRSERESRHAAQMKAHLESVAIAQQQAAAAAARGIDSGPMFCPSCRREYPPGTAYCSFDSNRLVAVRGHEHMMSGPSGGICPTCRRGFNPGVKTCPHDGDELVPASRMGAPTMAMQTIRGKICPTCSSRYEGTSSFCVKDGTPLAVLN
jgi:hypothetical protein